MSYYLDMANSEHYYAYREGRKFTTRSKDYHENMLWYYLFMAAFCGEI